jgi:hypothetical protein
MVFRHTELLVLLLTAQAGCFREPAAPTSMHPPTALSEVAVRDLHGVTYPEDAAPRDLTLALPAPDDARLADGLVLLRGTFHDAFVARLGSGRLTARVAALSIPLAVEARDASLLLKPAGPLAVGASYTLLARSDAGPATFHFTVSTSPQLGAQLVESLPGDGQVAVPRDLARVLVRFDGAVEGALGDALTLRDARDGAVAARAVPFACETLGLAAGRCAWLLPEAPLAPRAPYTIALDATLHTATGAPIAPVRRHFETDADADPTAPAFAATRCADDARALPPLCAHARPESVDLSGTLAAPALVQAASAGALRATLAPQGTFALSDLPLDASRAVLVRATDLRGRVHELTVVVPPEPALAALSIDEVRADPRGKEPDQEYVELLNSGPEPMSLKGFTLSTGATRAHAIDADERIAPGERVLLVSPAFDPRDAADGPLPDGVRLVRLRGPLALANAGRALSLRDARGRPVSAAPATPAPLEGQCSARRSADPRAGNDEAFVPDPEGACTPGRATFVPP